MASSSKFYSLSEELLTAIADYVIFNGDYYGKSPVPNLRALRLSSPRFAHLSLIMKRMFQSVQLIGTPEHYDHVVETDISRLAPYAETVVFVAPFQSWTLTYEGFKEIVLVQAIQKYGADHDIWDGMSSYTYDEDGHKHFIDEHWHGKLPFSDEEIQRGFEQHQHRAMATKSLLLGDELRTAWTEALQALTSISKVRLESVEWSERGGDHLPTQPDFVVRPHHHYPNHPAATCRRLMAPAGDALFAAGVRCLAEAGTKPRDLEIACAMTSIFRWENLPGWEELDLTELRRLYFKPDVGSIGEDFDTSEFGSFEEVALRAADATAAVMKKCSSSLHEFKYGSECPMQWPGDDVVHMPNLKRVTLGTYGSDIIRHQAFKRWLPEMPSLEYINIGGSRLASGVHLSKWLDVFDAIRDHPNGMRVEMDQAVANSAAEISLDYHTDDYEDYLKLPKYEELWEDMCERSLQLYLSGKIEYNDAMKDWLEDA